MPAGWETTGWSSCWGRTLSCSSGFPRRGMRWTLISNGRSCCPRRCGGCARRSPSQWLPP
eukprot:5003335-Alexandrium_andersonii.AAC.1